MGASSDTKSPLSSQLVPNMVRVSSPEGIFLLCWVLSCCTQGKKTFLNSGENMIQNVRVGSPAPAGLHALLLLYHSLGTQRSRCTGSGVPSSSQRMGTSRPRSCASRVSIDCGQQRERKGINRAQR